MIRCMYDLYHLDPWARAGLRVAAAAGWPLFVHKLSQGMFADPKGVGRLNAALTPGSGVQGIGGYLYMTATDSPAAQVAAFMQQRARVGGKLINILDFEPSVPSGAAERMASEIVNALHAVHGVWPMLYTGRWDITPIPMDNLPACPLWLAEYGVAPIPPARWSPPIWHQYSDGTAGPHPVDIPGIGRVDQSEFLGSTSLVDAIAWWMVHAV